MTKQQIRIVIGSIVIIAIATLVIYVNMNQGRPKKNYQITNSASGASAQTPKASPVKVPTANKTAAPKPTQQALTYEAAVNQYENRLMQFNQSCGASPSYMMFKNNSALMIDNRSSVKRTIAIGEKSYALNPYGFLIVTLTSKTLPGSLGVNCDKQYNVAKISLQP